MESYFNDLEIEEKLLNNSLLFSSIRKNKTPEDKIKKIKKYLDRGADINATDANDKNNTPLHVAVLKEEPEVVRFLLNQGAHVDIKNSENKTASNIAGLLHKSSKKKEDIVTLLMPFVENKLIKASGQQGQLTKKGHLRSIEIIEDSKTFQPVAYDIQNQIQSPVENNSSSVPITKHEQSKSKHQLLDKTMKKIDANKLFFYKKRKGTSGLSGQLYESKLLTLILFRALYVYKVQNFLLATNVENMGAFDDIVFRFLSSEGNKPKIMFIQAKHKENPTKDKFTVEEVLKFNGDFSIHKYLESYIKISQMFVHENCDELFRGEFKNMDCEFIIYTSATENFSQMKAINQTEGKHFINTSEGKMFQFDYDDQDIECLMQTVAKSRAALLAKRLSKFIFQNNYNNMMTDDLLKTYHVFLARYILEIEIKDGESQNNFHHARFRESLFTSDDELLIAFKNSICQELKKYICCEEQTEVENALISSSFEVPVDFGNLNFCFNESEKEIEEKLEYLCFKFQQLFANAKVTENIVMKVDDNMVGPNKILQSSDLEVLGGLVGNLFVYDDETKALKFNPDVYSLFDHNLKLLERLKSNVFTGLDVSKCRFDFNVYGFPRLSLVLDENDRSFIELFLNALIFYTNQAKEDEVEKILKREIDKYYVGSKQSHNDILFRVKSDAIFLKVHNRIQKWWQQPTNAPYLTESCEYFFDAQQSFLNSPLLNILNFTYIKTIKNALPAVKFKNSATEIFNLCFSTGSAKILTIITEENSLSSIKLIQYLEAQKINDYTFIDLDYVENGNYFVDIKCDLKDSDINTLIVVCKNLDLVAEINLMISNFQGKVMIICNRQLADLINKISTEDIVEIVDSQTGFDDLTDATSKTLLEDRFIVFQGEKVPLSILFEDKSYHLINSNVLYKIIINNNIAIGKCFNNPAFDEMSDVYINVNICRYITLDSNVHKDDSINILEYNELEADFVPDTRDIILIANKDEEFAEFINKHEKCNVHWFISDKELLIWQKSRGKLMSICKHIIRNWVGVGDAYVWRPVTLKDLSEKVVIISAEPGIGKSFLLTGLAINTKNKYPALWISKINLLEYTEELKRLKEQKVNIDINETVHFLFRVIGLEAKKERKTDFDSMIDDISVVDDNIRFNKDIGEMNLSGSSRFEIELFVHCYNNDRVALLFDGFDEICPDFTNEFLQLVNILKMSKVVHLWITSRLYNVLHHLENTLDTFSFVIEPLHRDEQIYFIQKLVLRKFDWKVLDKYHRHGVWSYYQQVTAAFGEDCIEFLRAPLHLLMITELYQDDLFNVAFDPRDVNLCEVYESFLDVKFYKIRFGEKKPLLCINDPDIRILIDNERAEFFHNHKIMGYYVIFGQSDDEQFLNSHDIDKIYDYIDRIKGGEEKTGIIEQIIGNKPKFFHYTFAEYFAAEFLYDKMKSVDCRSVWMFLINLFLQSEGYGTIRFFNAKLEDPEEVFNEIYNIDLREMFKTLFLDHQKFSKLLFNVIDNEFENIAIILLRFVKGMLTKKNLNDFIKVLTRYSYGGECIMCRVVTRSPKNIFNFIIELIRSVDNKRTIDLFYCTNLPNCNLLANNRGLRDSFKMVVGLLYVVLYDLTASELVELYCQSIIFTDPNDIAIQNEMKIIHLLIIQWLDGRILSWFEKTLKKLNRDQLMIILRARDYKNRTAAHFAALQRSSDFFSKLEPFLDTNQFREICMAQDNTERTPIDWFEESEEIS
ncbi:hypothetical protein PYW08_005207 [Mythimna loreyi]|uniref:Uncharacterized protein n=1 Tax=Mythimna loreyi TaxID=667449 RepID=A0ACC2QFK7_9NEOP|nr:hypothetical protein PYW08_005207 [Mythimna loreyi]